MRAKLPEISSKIGTWLRHRKKEAVWGFKRERRALRDFFAAKAKVANRGSDKEELTREKGRDREERAGKGGGRAISCCGKLVLKSSPSWGGTQFKIKALGGGKE